MGTKEDKFFRMAEQSFPLSSLPDHILSRTLSFMAYHEISKAREVNKRFNALCQNLLDQGLISVQKRISSSREV